MIIAKKYKLILLFLLIVTLLAGCKQNVPAATEKAAALPPISNPALSADAPSISSDDYFQDYQKTGGEVALITDFSSIMDHGFNEAAYEGTKAYAQSAGVSYSYYSASSNSDVAYKKTIEDAISSGSKLLICAGSNFQTVIEELQDDYPDIDFLLLDGVPVDASGKEISLSKNVHCITYKEEEAGYLAGYMAVLEGYTKFGFIGGEDLPSVVRYGYGYLQGINDAALFTDSEAKIDVNYWYSNTFNPNDEITKRAQEWYQSGTEIIFSCGGAIYESVLTAADLCDGKLIGVDVNQSQLSPRIVTSAMKEITNSVILTLDDYCANGDVWSEEAAGQIADYGATEKCIALPTDNASWRFEQVTTNTYDALYTKLKKIVVDHSTKTPPSVSINVTYIKP